MTLTAYVFPKLPTIRKTWLDKCLKSPFEMTPQQATWKTGRNTDTTLTAARLPYSLINPKVTEFKKVTLSYIQSLKTFC